MTNDCSVGAHPRCCVTYGRPTAGHRPVGCAPNTSI